MLREIHHPENESAWLKLRQNDVTSTQVAALFGLSPYCTEFELYHRIKNREIVDDFIGNRFTKWGQRLEPVIAAGIAEDQGWVIRPKKEYINLPEHRIGASFDFEIIGETDHGAYPEGKGGILEIKNVFGMIFQNQWITEDGDIEAPPHIEIQVQTQLAVSGLDFCYIGALVSGNQAHLLKRVRDEEIIDEIFKRVEKFWHKVDNSIEPKPDFIKDYEVISKLYGYAEPNKIMDARKNVNIFDLAGRYKAASEREKNAATEKKQIKSELLMAIGDAEKVVHDNFSISAKMIAPTIVPEYERAGYRGFRINWRKKK